MPLYNNIDGTEDTQVMKTGDLAKLRYSGLVGVVLWVDEQYPPQCSILIDGRPTLADTRAVEIINESRQSSHL